MAKCKIAVIGIRIQVPWGNERNSMGENERLFVGEAFSELMAAKEKKGELFYLCKTAAAMEQIEIASSCQRPLKAVGR